MARNEGFISRVALVLTVIIVVAACDYAHDFDQEVSIRITQVGAPIARSEVRYYDSQECNGTFATGVSNTDGMVTIRRIAKRGRFFVLLEKPSLCLKQAGHWVEIWSNTQDPPDRLEVTCEMDGLGNWGCTYIHAAHGV